MEIEEVKLWQWMLAGLVAGFLFSSIYAFSGPGFENQHRDTVLAGEFESLTYPFATYKKLAQDGRVRSEMGKIASLEEYNEDAHGNMGPLLRNVIVHPPLRGDTEHRYCVTGEKYMIKRRPKANGKGDETYSEWVPFEYAASTPYVPGYTLQINKEIKKDTDDHQTDHAYKYKNGWVPSSREDFDMASLKKSLGDKESFPTVVEYLKAASAIPGSTLSFRKAWWELPQFLWSLPPLAGFLIFGVAWPMTLNILQNVGVAKRAPVKAPPRTIKKPDLMNIPSTAGVILQPVTPAPPPPPSESKEYGGEFYPVVKVHHDEKPAAVVKPKTAPKTAPAKTK